MVPCPAVVRSILSAGARGLSPAMRDARSRDSLRPSGVHRGLVACEGLGVIRIRRISTQDLYYQQERRLRESVLLEPLGLDLVRFDELFPGIEERGEHFAAIFDHPSGDRVVGCAILLPDDPEPGTGRVMQMGVDVQRRGEGIGRRLVVAVEGRAFGELGLDALMCHARSDAVPFYEKLGWWPEGEMFDEVGIPHRRMWLRAHEGAG